MTKFESFMLSVVFGITLGRMLGEILIIIMK